jgi:NAD(P)-dependent dehydrogenase (short-subunit alcohol dehydrogenase family)
VTPKPSVVIVIGAAAMGSIGHACAVQSAREGSAVVLLDIQRPSEAVPPVEHEREWKGLQSVVREIEAAGGVGSAITGDVTKVDDLRECVNRAEDLGRLRGLVNTSRAPLEPSCSSVDLDDQALLAAFDVNVRGALLSTQLAARVMQRYGSGSIVHISSIAGLHPLPGRTSYSVTKAALNMLTRSMAQDLARSAVRVNGVCPGIIATNRVDPDEVRNADRHGQSLTEYRSSLTERQGALVPMGRTGDASEIARVVSFLLSDASSYMTGEIVNVSGGLSGPPAARAR